MPQLQQGWWGWAGSGRGSQDCTSGATDRPRSVLRISQAYFNLEILFYSTTPDSSSTGLDKGPSQN